MPTLPTTAGFYSTGHWMTTCGSDAGVTAPEVLTFDFMAKGVRVVNTCADVLFFSLTTDPASTSSAYLAGGGTLQIENLFTPGISLATTSTSTVGSLPTARPRVSVVAWGS